MLVNIYREKGIVIGGELIAGLSSKVVSKYQYKKNYSQTANILKRKGKYNGYNEGVAYKYM